MHWDDKVRGRGGWAETKSRTGGKECSEEGVSYAGSGRCRWRVEDGEDGRVGMPSFLVDWPRDEDGRGPAKGVGSSGIFSMVGMLVVAGDWIVLWIFEVPLGPTIKSMGAKVRTTRRSDSWRDSRKTGRRSDRAWCGRCCIAPRRGGGAGRVGAMETGAIGGGAEAPILISGAEVSDKVRESFIGFCFRAPIATRSVEQASGKDKVISKTDNGGFGRFVVAGDGEAYAVVESSEGVCRLGLESSRRWCAF